MVGLGWTVLSLILEIFHYVGIVENSVSSDRTLFFVKLTDEELIAIAGKPEITEAMKLYHKAKERYQDKGASA